VLGFERDPINIIICMNLKQQKMGKKKSSEKYIRFPDWSSATRSERVVMPGWVLLDFSFSYLSRF
jgi:hypothetical protein